MFEDVFATARRLSIYLLSHHPNCAFFDHDVYHLFGKRICLGCSIAYPTAIMIILTSFLMKWYGSIPEILFHQDLLLVASLIFGSFQFIKYQGLSFSKPLNIFIKLSLGISLGGLVIWIFTLPIHFVLQILLFVLSFVMVQFIGTLRFRNIRITCADCIYHGDWDICQGFRNINRYEDFKHITDRRNLEKLIFDREGKKGRPKRKGVHGHEEAPIDIRDRSKRWTYHNGSYDIPWLPRSGMEVTEYNDIPSERTRKGSFRR